jgi:hypothetical protein
MRTMTSSVPANTHMDTGINLGIYQTNFNEIILIIYHEDVTLVNMKSGNWSKPITTIASLGQPHQPKHILEPTPTLLKNGIYVRAIGTQGTGQQITINDDHTCIERSGPVDEPAVVIIDRRTLFLFRVINHTSSSTAEMA